MTTPQLIALAQTFPLNSRCLCSSASFSSLFGYLLGIPSQQVQIRTPELPLLPHSVFPSQLMIIPHFLLLPSYLTFIHLSRITPYGQLHYGHPGPITVVSIRVHCKGLCTDLLTSSDQVILQPILKLTPKWSCKTEVGSCCCPGLNSLWCPTSLIVMAKLLSLSPYSGLEDISAVLPPPIYIHHIHTHFPSVFLRVLLLAVSSQSLCASYTGFCAIYQPTSHAPVLGPLHLLFLLPRMLSSHLPTWLIPSPPSDVIPLVKTPLAALLKFQSPLPTTAYSISLI